MCGLHTVVFGAAKDRMHGHILSRCGLLVTVYPIRRFSRGFCPLMEATGRLVENVADVLIVVILS